MKAYQAVALDVIQITHPRYTWVNENFEVLSSRFVGDEAEALQTIAVELDLAQTDPTVYAWSIAEELTPQGYAPPSNVSNSVCVPPNGLTLYSGPATIINGISISRPRSHRAERRLHELALRDVADAERHQRRAGRLHRGAIPGCRRIRLDGVGTVRSVRQFALYHRGQRGFEYNVQIRAVNCAGVPSPGCRLARRRSAVRSRRSLTTRSRGSHRDPDGSIHGGRYADHRGPVHAVRVPGLCTPSPSILTGLNPSQLYFVYYVDPTFAGGTITPIATQNESNFLNLPGYFLIGSLVTPAASARYQPSSYADVGTSMTTPHSRLRQQHQHRGGRFRQILE